LGCPAQPATEQALEELARHGLLIEGPPLPDEIPTPVSETTELLATLRPGSRPLADTGGAVASCSIGLVGEGTAGSEVARCLLASGVALERAEAIPPGVDLTVCAPSAAELPRLGEWNAQALEASLPWLQVLPFDGRYASIGPLYLPGETCCYECFRL